MAYPVTEKSKTLFSRLKDVFKSGTPKKKKYAPARNDLNLSATSIIDTFKANSNFLFQNVMSSASIMDRQSRYMDFTEFSYYPEVSASLNVYASEIFAKGENDHAFQIYSENENVKKLLSDLFYSTLNIENEGYYWAYNFCKYGDFFGILDINEENGVVGFYPIPVNEVEVEYGFDAKNPTGIRYKWVTQNNYILQNFQVAHFKILSDNEYGLYGTSVLDSVRRYIRFLILLEDAMLIYRLARSPTRRLISVPVDSVPEEDVPQYMEQVAASLKTSSVSDKDEGRVDLRFNPMNVLDDYFVATRGSNSLKIENLSGGEYNAVTEDLDFVLRKIFMGIGVPKAYLNYGDEISSKSTLSSIDIQFSRRIQRLQRQFISELEKIAIVHLLVNGVEGEDLFDFRLELNAPSSVAEQQRLSELRTKLEMMSQYRKDSTIDQDTMRKMIFKFNDKEIQDIERGLIKDQMRNLKLTMIQGEDVADMDSSGGLGGGDSGGSLFGGLTSGYQPDVNKNYLSESFASDISEKINNKRRELDMFSFYESHERSSNDDFLFNALEKQLLGECTFIDKINESSSNFLGSQELSETVWSALSSGQKRKYMRNRNWKRQYDNNLGSGSSNMEKSSAAKKDQNFAVSPLVNTDPYKVNDFVDAGEDETRDRGFVGTIENSYDDDSDDDVLIESFKLHEQICKNKMMSLEMDKGPVLLPESVSATSNLGRMLIELKKTVLFNPASLDTYRRDYIKQLVQDTEYGNRQEEGQ